MLFSHFWCISHMHSARAPPPCDCRTQQPPCCSVSPNQFHACIVALLASLPPLQTGRARTHFLSSSTAMRTCSALFLPPSLLGPYLNDVRSEGGRGGWPKSRRSKGGCVDLVLQISPNCGQGRGRGSKILKILRTSFKYGPLRS